MCVLSVEWGQFIFHCHGNFQFMSFHKIGLQIGMWTNSKSHFVDDKIVAVVVVVVRGELPVRFSKLHIMCSRWSKVVHIMCSSNPNLCLLYMDAIRFACDFSVSCEFAMNANQIEWEGIKQFYTEYMVGGNARPPPPFAPLRLYNTPMLVTTAHTHELATVFGQSGKLVQNNHFHSLNYILCMHTNHFIYEHNLILGRIFQKYFNFVGSREDPPAFSILLEFLVFLFFPSNSPAPLALRTCFCVGSLPFKTHRRTKKWGIFLRMKLDCTFSMEFFFRWLHRPWTVQLLYSCCACNSVSLYNFF